MHSWSTFGARTNHGQTRTHKTHHSLDFEEAITFPLIVLFMPDHGASTQMSFCLGTPKLGIPKFSKLGLLRLWRPITFFVDLRLRWGPKKSCSPRSDLSNDMWHTTCMQINQGDSYLLMVEAQIGNLIFGFSFGHNLCFKYQNGSCEPILNIYIVRDFQWYKEFFNQMNFDL